MSYDPCDTCDGYAPFGVPCPSNACPASGWHYLCVACFDALHPGPPQVLVLMVCPLRDADDVAKVLMEDE